MQINREKLEYLRTHTTLSPVNKAKLFFLKRMNISQNEIDVAEYAYRFSSYQNMWYKTWKDLNWGMKEDEGLSAFADSALEQAISKEKKSNQYIYRENGRSR